MANKLGKILCFWGELKADVHQLKADVGELKADVHQLKADVGELKADVHQLKVDVHQLSLTLLSIRSKSVWKHWKPPSSGELQIVIARHFVGLSPRGRLDQTASDSILAKRLRTFLRKDPFIH